MSATVPRPCLAVAIRELLRAQDAPVDDVVPEHDHERLVADDVACAEHRVTEAERLLLPHRDVLHLRDGSHLLLELVLAGPLEVRLQLGGDVEVVDDRLLAARGSELTSRTPAATASATMYWIVGVSTIESNSFGTAFVAGGSACRASCGDDGLADRPGLHGARQSGSDALCEARARAPPPLRFDVCLGATCAAPGRRPGGLYRSAPPRSCSRCRDRSPDVRGAARPR